MALFGKKNSGSAEAPPAPPKADSMQALPPVGNIPEPTPGVDSLSPPPIPGGSFADIKSEVAQKPASMRNVEAPEAPPLSDDEKDGLDDDKILSDDSLFDFSELETQIAGKADDSPKQIESVNKPSAPLVKESEDYDPVEHKGVASSSKITDSLHYSKGDRRVVAPNETYFLTTKQFKSLLGIVEDVKVKVKDASETHLKLLDLKAEEDIEYDNLRKSFQFIEDKLYEVDNLIFEK